MIPGVVSFTLVSVLVLIHGCLPSNLNTFSGPQLVPYFNSARILESIQQHRDFPPFAVRPVTTKCIEGVEHFFHVSPVSSFMIVNFGALFVCGLLLACISKQLSPGIGVTIVSITTFYFSFSVALAFFNPLDTYDEPLQYVCIFAALAYLMIERYALFAVAVTLACCTRESSLILAPSVMLLAYGMGPPDHRIRRLLMTVSAGAVSIALFVIWKIFFVASRGLSIPAMEYVSTELLTHWNRNTSTLRECAETVSMCFAVLALPMYLIAHLLRSGRATKSQRSFAFATVMGVCLNTAIVLFTGLAREARLFALPLLFFWPIAGICLSDWWKEAKPRIARFFNAPHEEEFLRAVRYLTGAATLLVFVWVTYHPTTFEASPMVLRLYLSVLILIAAVMLLFGGNRARSNRFGR
jgi:hypothetical protein